jgi:hypothetical protein
MTHRINDLSGQNQPRPKFRRPSVACQSCGKTLPSGSRAGRSRQFCSNGCRQKGQRDRKAVQRFKNGFRYGTPGALRNDAKNPYGIGVSAVDFPGRGSGIQAPRHVVEVELLAARNWTETTSTDGVKSFVSILRTAALRNGGAP